MEGNEAENLELKAGPVYDYKTSGGNWKKGLGSITGIFIKCDTHKQKETTDKLRA